MNIIVTS